MMRLDAFISYSHAADGRLAPALQRGLQRFAKPWNRAYAVRVFRDQTDLAANPGLWSSIEAALRDSRFFILLASPAAATSGWIQREVAFWREHRTADSLLVVLTDGEIRWTDTERDFDWEVTTALPQNLRGFFSEEPRFIDLRWAQHRDALSLSHAQFQDAIAEIAAPLHGVSKTELASEEVRANRKTRRLAQAAAIGLAALVITTSIAAAVAITRARTASSRELAALALANLERDPEFSLFLALRGFDTAPTDEAKGAIQQALSTSRVRMTFNGESDSGGIRDVAFSPDGKRLAAACRNLLKVWDLTSGREILRVQADADYVRRVVFSPDGSMIGTSGDQGVTLWDSSTGQQRLKITDADVTPMVFSPDGGTVATGHLRGTTIWDARSGKALVTLTQGETWVSDVVFSPDSQTLATSGDDGSIVLWDVTTRQRVRSLPGHKDGVHALDFSPEGSRLVSAGDNGILRVWDVTSGEAVLNISGHTQGVWDVAFSRDGSRIASAGNDQLAKLYDATTGTEIMTLAGHATAIFSIALSPDGTRAVTAGIFDNWIKVWDITSAVSSSVLRGHAAKVLAVRFSRDGKILTSVAEDGTAIVWDAKSGRQLSTFSGEGSADAAIGPDGRAWVTVDRRVASPSVARIWRAFSGVGVTLLSGHTNYLTDVAFSDDGSRVATMGADGTARIWNAVTGQLTQRIVFEGNRAVFTPDGKRLATMSLGGAFGMWDGDTGASIPLPIPEANDLAFTADGRRAAVYRNWYIENVDGTLSIVDVASGRRITTIRNQSEVRALAFTPDGTRLATADGDFSVRIWDAESGERLSSFSGHLGDVNAIAFSPDGVRLATGGTDRTVRMFYAPPVEDLIELARERVTRRPTTLECRWYLRLDECPDM